MELKTRKTSEDTWWTDEESQVRARVRAEFMLIHQEMSFHVELNVSVLFFLSPFIVSFLFLIISFYFEFEFLVDFSSSTVYCQYIVVLLCSESESESMDTFSCF